MPQRPPWTPGQGPSRKGGSGNKGSFNKKSSFRPAGKGGGGGDVAAARALLEQYWAGQGGEGDMYPGGFRAGGGGGGGGGYGGGGGGYADYLAKLEAARKQAEAELIGQRDRQLGEFSALKNAAIPAIDRYAGEYAGNIGRVFNENRAQGAAYGKELGALGQQVRTGLAQAAMPMQRDLQAQGAGTAGLQNDLGAFQGLAGALAGAQGGFNTRLGQVQNAANADFRSLGHSTQQAARSTAENEYMAGSSAITNQYAEALMKLRMAGLT